MACFMIGCRLGGAGDDSIALLERIEELGRSWQCPGHTWILATDLDAAGIRDALRPCLGPCDELLVAQLGGSVAWGGTSRAFADGLRAVLG